MESLGPCETDDTLVMFTAFLFLPVSLAEGFFDTDIYVLFLLYW
jgi:hypothetical protein